MASQNIIENNTVNGHKIEIYQDAKSKFRWRAFVNNNDNIGSSEQAYNTLEECKKNLNGLACALNLTVTENTSNIAPLKDARGEKEIIDIKEIAQKSEESYIDSNIYWLVMALFILSLYCFIKLFLPLQ
jgi:uncharacterized protein YegP (UPF0339 family)